MRCHGQLYRPYVANMLHHLVGYRGSSILCYHIESSLLLHDHQLSELFAYKKYRRKQSKKSVILSETPKVTMHFIDTFTVTARC